MKNFTIHNEDALDFAARYDGEPFHALLCDPPYELGFMGKSWDKSGVVFKPETWAAFARLLHPGAFGMAFASSRGWHRLACAIEDAGLVIHPSIFGWGFGSGFPKATRVADAPTFASHRYGLQALKPALEPIIVFQRPYSGKPVDCITATGAGALWIDGGRVGTTESDDYGRSAANSRGTINAHNGFDGKAFNIKERDAQYASPAGRWPSNLTLSHSPACNGTCAPECAVLRLGQQSGESVSRASDYNWSQSVTDNAVPVIRNIKSGQHFGDTGTAARFFFNAQYEQIDAADPVRYNAKASRKERDAGLEGMPLKQKVFNGQSQYSAGLAAGSVEDKFTTSPARNPHPTVKPIALIRHLATLLLPPAEYAPRRILIPFAGSGSEMIGAGLAGWDEVIGIEREAEYAEIAEKRVAYWLNEADTPQPNTQPELWEATA